MSKIFAPVIYFFADQTSIAPQQAGDVAFGPVAGSTTTKFRVTSLHTGISNVHPTAYAICEGRVRLQQDATDPTLVTLVLAPDTDLLRGVPIRYFIYRGIRRDSLISGNTLVAGSETNPLLTDQLLNDGDPSNDVPDALGLAFRGATALPPAPEFTREDSDSIDSLFFETTSLKALPVKAGDRLGEFSASGFGFEIMVASVWDPQPLSALRNVSVSTGNILEVPAGSTDAHARAIRERVYGYLDPCAFYGMCFKTRGGVRYRMGTSGSAKASSAQDIYENLLIKFHNRNRVYLDIRNENGLSYNYYDTYGTGKIKLGLDTGSLQRLRGDNPALGILDEFYDTSEWPLKIIESSRFTVPSGTEKIGIRLALNIGDPSPIAQRHVFYDFGYLFYNANNKKRRNQLFESRDALRWENVLKDSPDGVWTKDVVLAVPAVTNNTDTWPIAFHARLRYFRQSEPQPSTSGRYISTGGQWDNIFILQTDVERWKNTNTSNWWLTGQIKHVQTELEDQQVYEGRVEAGFAVDRDPNTLAPARYTFYYVPIHVDREPKWYDVFRGHNVAGTGGAFGSAAASFFQRKESGQTITGSKHLQLHKVSEFYEWNPDPRDSSLVDPPADPSAYLYFLTFLENPEFAEANDKTTNPNHSKESLYAISFSAAEYGTLLSHIVTAGLDLSLHPAFLQVRNRIYPRTDETATERAYQALELRIVGLDQAGNYCDFDVPSSGPGAILPLSLPADGFLFCTNDAARFENLKTKWDYIQICTQFRHPSMSGPTKDAEHQTDFIYFGRAMADIKRFHPTLHQRMSILRNNGVEVILPGNPPRRKRYLIKVFFADDLTNASGDTETPPRDDLIHIRNLQTAASLPLPSSDPGLTAFGGINETRYVRLNANRLLRSSDVNAQFMSDYTDQELAAGQILSNRLYVERASSTGTNAPRFRTTLAELKTLGLAAFDPLQPFVIRISRPKLYKEHKDKEFRDVPSPTNPGTTTPKEIPGLNPRRWALAETLGHELGHAEKNILDPLAKIVWSQIDAYFSGAVFDPRPGTGTITTVNGLPDVQGTGTLFIAELREGDNVIFNTRSYVVKTVIDDTHLILDRDANVTAALSFSIVKLITKEIDPAAKFSFANFKLLRDTAYPNPTPIVTLNPALDAQLNVARFMAKTGDGHLRGSPSGQHSCEAGDAIARAMAQHADALLKAAQPKDVTFPPYRYGVDYCFLNLDNANLNPSNTN